MGLTPFSDHVSTQIVMFKDTALLLETLHDKYHWIWHALMPKYMPLKQFWCIFDSQGLQNVNIGLPETVIF